MLNLLNAVDIFGKQLGWNSKVSLGLFITLAVVLLVIAIVLIAYVAKLRRKRAAATDTTETVVTVAEPAPSKTEVVYIQAAEPVRTEPTTVIVEKPVIVEKVVEKVVEVEKPVVVEKVVEVEKPIVYEKVVHREPVETIIIDEESVEAGRLRYDKSFEARLIQSDDETKHWYTELKNELLSYKTCKGRLSWKRETFKANKQVVALLAYRGKTLCLFLPLKPTDYNEDYHLEDVSDTPVYEETPAMLRIKNDKRVRIAKELIATVMNNAEVSFKTNYVSEDFYVPYEGILELINRGLIKRVIREVADEAIFDKDKKDEE